MKFDGAHLHALQDAARVIDKEIVFMPPVLLLDRDRMDCIAQRAAVMLLEKALFRAALRAAHQADGTIGDKREHDRGDGRVIVGQFPLGLSAIRENHALTARDCDVASFRCDRLRHFGTYRCCLLVVAQAEEAAVTHVAIRRELRKRDFRDQLGRDPGNTARARPVGFYRRRLAFEPAHFFCQLIKIFAGKAGAHIALIYKFAALVLCQQE